MSLRSRQRETNAEAPLPAVFPVLSSQCSCNREPNGQGPLKTHFSHEPLAFFPNAYWNHFVQNKKKETNRKKKERKQARKEGRRRRKAGRKKEKKKSKRKKNLDSGS